MQLHGNCILMFWMLTNFAAHTKILYVDPENNIVSKLHTNSNNEKMSEESHLPLSALFSQSDKYNCLVEGGNTECAVWDQQEMTAKHTKRSFGPRYQPIHLALPKREQQEVGFIEDIRCNGRKMSLKTLSKSPYIFEVTNFLSDNETELLVDMAQEKGMMSPDARQAVVHLPSEINQPIFDKWDIDFDGHLSLLEMHSIVELNSLLLSEADLNETFAATNLDKDDNGYISYGELANGGLKRFKDCILQREKQRNKQKVEGIREAWLWHDDDELLMYEGLLEDYHSRINALTGLSVDVIEQTEPVQVTESRKNSFSHCHQDSSAVDGERACCTYGAKDCRMCRYISIFMFLNDFEDGGVLVFPFADNKTFSWKSLKEDTIKKCEKFPSETLSNIAVKPRRGKAVIWYNHGISPYTGWMSQLDPQAIIGRTRVRSGVQWTASMWLDVIGDGVKELRPWRMGTNWLSKNNKNKNVIEEMRNDFFREGENYIHQHRTSYKRMEEEEIVPEKPPVINDISNKKNIQTDPNPNAKKGRFGTDKDSLIAPLKQVETITSTKISHKSMETTITSNKINKQFLAQLLELGYPEDKKTTTVCRRTETSNIKKPVKPIHQPPGMPNLTIHAKQREVPLGPPKRPLDPESFTGGRLIENRLVKASLLLLEELERDELEIIARSLHDKLQLACIPLIVNPLG